MDGVCALYRRKNQERNFRFSLSLFLSRSFVCSLPLSLSPLRSLPSHMVATLPPPPQRAVRCDAVLSRLFLLLSSLMHSLALICEEGSPRRPLCLHRTCKDVTRLVLRRRHRLLLLLLPPSPLLLHLLLGIRLFLLLHRRRLRGCTSAQGGRLLLIVGGGRT